VYCNIQNLQIKLVRKWLSGAAGSNALVAAGLGAINRGGLFYRILKNSRYHSSFNKQ
jgi:hypothetical protein